MVILNCCGGFWLISSLLLDSVEHARILTTCDMNSYVFFIQLPNISFLFSSMSFILFWFKFHSVDMYPLESKLPCPSN